MYATILSILTVVTVTLQVFNWWYIRKDNKRYYYPLTISAYTGYLIVETMLALHTPEQTAILLYSGLNLWILSQAVIGYRDELSKNK